MQEMQKLKMEIKDMTFNIDGEGTSPNNLKL